MHKSKIDRPSKVSRLPSKDALSIVGILVDDTALANDYVLVYDSASGTLKYEAQAGGSGSYTPAVPDDWEDIDPATVIGALNRMAGGHAGVCLISDTKPTTPGNGQVWLDTDATGASGLGTLNFVTITADLVLTSSHTLVYADASAGPIVVTVPAAAGNGRKLYAIIKIDATANAVTMDGGFDAVLTCQDEAVPIHSEGTDWRIPF